MKLKLSAIDYLRRLFIEEFKILPSASQDVVVEKLTDNQIKTVDQFLNELKRDDDLVGWLLYEVCYNGPTWAGYEGPFPIAKIGLEPVFESKETDVFKHGKTYIQVTRRPGADYVYDFVKPKTIKIPTKIYVKI